MWEEKTCSALSITHFSTKTASVYSYQARQKPLLYNTELKLIPALSSLYKASTDSPPLSLSCMQRRIQLPYITAALF